MFNFPTMKSLRWLLVVSFLIQACTQKRAESIEIRPHSVLTGLSGIDYFKPEWSTETKARLDSNLQVAQLNFSLNPSEENYIWLGRRQAYLYDYDSAIATFTEGLSRYPDSYRLLRHRGHRYITLRQFAKAISDFETAARLMEGRTLEVEPDGQPNAQNIPLSTTQFNVWYHLGLAHYLLGNFAEAEKAYLACLAVCQNDDSVVATADWLYMTYQRQGKKTEAAQLLARLKSDLTILENDSYLIRLKLYRGQVPVDSVLQINAAATDADLSLATQGYGVGNWFLYHGDTAHAKAILQRVVDGKHFSAFGFIAAEADLLRLK
jgi:tetratricopeptide (TPR) repeat protein